MSNVLELPARADTEKTMAEHLVAGVIGAQLNTSSDIAVIEYLRHTPEKYHARFVLDHYDAALVEAKRILDEMYEAKFQRDLAATRMEMGRS
jgi:hypothetical protein